MKALSWVCLFLLAVLGFNACSDGQDWRDQPQYRLEVHQAALDKPLAQRITSLMPELIGYLNRMDATTAYGDHEVSPEETQLFASYLDLLDPDLRKLLEEKVAAVHLVENFQGGGMADAAFDKDKNLYIILYLNPAVFHTSLQEWIGLRDTLPFLASPEIALEISCSGDYQGLIHTLIHEAAHVWDYYHQVTPWIDHHFKTIHSPRSTAFTKGVWEDYGVPVKFYDFLRSSGYSGYGMKKKIAADQILPLYRRLAESPFSSLYGAGSWAEDFAETYTWWFLEEQCGVKYRTSIKRSGAEEFSFDPGASPEVLKRRAALKEQSGL